MAAVSNRTFFLIKIQKLLTFLQVKLLNAGMINFNLTFILYKFPKIMFFIKYLILNNIAGLYYSLPAFTNVKFRFSEEGDQNSMQSFISERFSLKKAICIYCSDKHGKTYREWQWELSFLIQWTEITIPSRHVHYCTGFRRRAIAIYVNAGERAIDSF